MFGMANLFPDDTGLTVIVHVYKNIDSKARHGPRVKAFPGHPREGDATTIRVPGRSGDRAEIVGKVTISATALRKVRAFTERNWPWLLLYWYEPDFSERDLLSRLER